MEKCNFPEWPVELQKIRCTGAACDVYIDFDWVETIGHRQKTLSGLGELTELVSEYSTEKGLVGSLILTNNDRTPFHTVQNKHAILFVVNVISFREGVSQKGKTGRFFFELLHKSESVGKHQVELGELLESLSNTFENLEDPKQLVSNIGGKAIGRALAKLSRMSSVIEDGENLEDFFEEISEEANHSIINLIELRKKRRTLASFHLLLMRSENESVWQEFLWNNKWLLGVDDSLRGATILAKEAFVKPMAFDGKGTRKVDFAGITSAEQPILKIVEIKRPDTPLLGGKYRNEIYCPSDELSGGVSQCLTYLDNVSEYRHTLKAPAPVTGLECVLVVGNTADLQVEGALTSFELFRRAISGVRIVTFDELYNRACYLIEPKSEPNSDLKNYAVVTQPHSF